MIYLLLMIYHLQIICMELENWNGYLYLVYYHTAYIIVALRCRLHSLVCVTKTFYFFPCRLDLGNGKNLDLEQCSRSKLQKQCIKYLGPVCASLIWMCVYIYFSNVVEFGIAAFLTCSIFIFLFSTGSYFPKLARERTVWIHCTRG